MKIALVIVGVLVFGMIAFYAVVYFIGYIEERRNARMTPEERRKQQEEMYKLHQLHNC